MARGSGWRCGGRDEGGGGGGPAGRGGWERKGESSAVSRDTGSLAGSSASLGKREEGREGRGACGTSTVCQKTSGKPDALLSSEQGNLIRSSVSTNANRSNLRGSLLEGKKDHFLNRSISDLAKQELHVESPRQVHR